MKKIISTLCLAISASTASAYEWPVDALPLTISLGDNVSAEWTVPLDRAAADWSVSPVLDVRVRKGSVRDNSNCKARNGRVEICNDFYGENNWLGLATLTVSGNLIESAVVRLNETYFTQAPYSDYAWRNMVMCHEVGHVFGVPHLDESWDNPPTGSCMDYSTDPSINQSPNNADYALLEELYADASSGGTTDPGTTDGGTTDGETTDGGTTSGGNDKPCRGKKCTSAFTIEDEDLDPGYWGKRKSGHGRHEIYERRLENNRKVITIVTRAR